MQAHASASQKSPEVLKGELSGPVPATKQKQPVNPWKPPGLLSEVSFFDTNVHVCHLFDVESQLLILSLHVLLGGTGEAVG
jgi:hypothetical protein